MKKIIEIRGNLALKRAEYISAMTDYYTSEEEDVQALAIDTATNALPAIEALEIEEMDAIRAIELARETAERKLDLLLTGIVKLQKAHK